MKYQKRIHGFLPIGLLLMMCFFFGGCSSTQPIEGSEDAISTLSLSCKKPYVLTQDCSFWSGPKRTIELEGFEIKVAANESGDVILVWDAHLYLHSTLDGFRRVFGKEYHGVASNNSFLAVRRLLERNGVNIVRFRPIKSFQKIDGYVLELDCEGYSLLKRYTLKE